MTLIPVILSGGAGTRLKTYRRAAAVADALGSTSAELLTVTNRDHYFMSKDDLAATRMGERHAGTAVLEILAAPFSQVSDICIDYAVMEHSSQVAVVPSNFGWSDIGSWNVVQELVEPGTSLSLQMHHHRSEREIFVSTNESTYIPAGHRHRLENPGVLDLVMIEVQSGEYLGEDDIVRFQDHYGRV